MNGSDLDPLTFPGYRLVVELGAGRNGTVWRGRELESQRLVAMKVYRPELLRRAGFVSGLDAAVLTARSFRHPAAAQVFGLIEARSGGGLALVMELVGGELLARALQRNVRFSAARALRLARDLADALAAAHAAGIFGGAVHPGHVVVYGESAKLLGLGWSHVEGLPLGYEHAPEDGRFAPAAYAAPELLSGLRPDGRSDVFALGALLYHMLTGVVPFRARDLAALKLERTEGLRWPRGADSVIPAEVLGLVGRSLELDPAIRPSAAEFAASAGRTLSGQRPAQPAAAAAAGLARPGLQLQSSPGVPEMPPAEAPEPPLSAAGTAPGAVRLRDFLGGAAAAALLIGGGLGLGWLAWGRAHPAPPPGTAEAPQGGAYPRPPQPPEPDRAAVAGEAARREWEAILAELEAKPAKPDEVKRRLGELAGRERASQWGTRARLKLDELLEAERAARLETYRRLAVHAGDEEKAGRFGAALELLERPPAELAGTELAARCADEAAELRRRAAAHFAQRAARAERSAADGDLKAAAADLLALAGTIGVEELAEKARVRAGEFGRQLELEAAREASRQEQVRREQADRQLGEGLRRARAHAAAYRYDEAVKELLHLAADPEQPEGARKLSGEYAELARAEKGLFGRAAQRVADGKREDARLGHKVDVVLTVGQASSPDVLTVRKLDGKGLTVSGGGGLDSLLVRWEDIPADQAYKVFKLTADLGNAREQLDLAVMAWHRGQRAETENGLELAGQEDAALKPRAAEIARTLAALEAAMGGSPGGAAEPAPVPRRRITE